MGKKSKVAKVETVATQQTTETAAPQQKPTVFTVIAPKRPLTGLKYGERGNAATHAALAAKAAELGGTITAAQAMEVCVAMQHKGFYAYAINRLHILQAVVA
jgi:hypothetical protein